MNLSNLQTLSNFGNLKTALTVTTVGFVTLMSSNMLLAKTYPETTDKWYFTALVGSLGVSLGSLGMHYLEGEGLGSVGNSESLE